MEDDENWKLQIDGGYVTGRYIVSNNALTPSSTLVHRGWGGEVAPLAAVRSSAGNWLAPAQRCRFTNPYEVCGATPRYLY